MPRAAAEQLNLHGCEAVMAHDEGLRGKSDPEHLAYASEHQFILVTFDRKFAGLTSKSSDHAGLICISGVTDDIGYIVRTLIAFAETYTQEDAAGQVFWL